MNDLRTLPTELIEFRSDTLEPSETWQLRARNRLTSEATTTARDSHPRWTPLRVVGVAAVIGVVAALTVGLLPTNKDNGQFGAENAAAAMLREAAGNADKAGPRLQLASPAKAYIYTRTRTRELKEVMAKLPGEELEQSTGLRYVEETLTDYWAPVDQSGQALERRTVVKREAYSPAAELAKAGVDLGVRNVVTEEKHQVRVEAKSTVTDPFQNPTPTALATLPIDPDQLLDVIRKAAMFKGKSTAHGQWHAVAGLLHRGDAMLTPELRKALFLAASKIKGLHISGQVADASGRPGTAIGTRQDKVRVELLVDPKTSRVLGERHIMAEDSDSLPKGTVLNVTSGSSAIVDGVGTTS